MSAIRAILVDDEPLARTRLRSLLADDSDVNVVAEAGNGEEALEAIEEHTPDLIFLDIQMPELDGFGVVEALVSAAASGGAERELPLIIFVTAYDEYALKAFEVHALDYLLKPVDRDRFAATLARAKTQLRARVPAARGPAETPSSDLKPQQLQPLLDHLGRRQRRDARLAIKTDGRVLFLRTQDIDWIEAVDNHAKLHVGRETHIVRDTLTRLEQRLPSGRFLRIHRSTIVNVERVRELQPWFQGDYVVILNDGTRLTSGRSYRQKLQHFVKEAL
jgi:two-component system LytT family response regulator